MVPPKKKRRVFTTNDETADATAGIGDYMDVDSGTTGETSLSDNASSMTIHNIACKDMLTKELVEELDRLESSENGSSEASNAHTNVSIALLKLKSLQRGLLEKVRKTQETLRQQAVVRDQQELQLNNLRYQQTIHARSQKRSDSACEKASTEIAKLNFLGDNWHDPSARSAIVSKLNQEVATRKDLENKRDKLVEDRKSKQDALSSRQKILKDLPAKLAEIERASLPLQKFFQKQSSTVPYGNSSSLVKVTPKLGTTKRRNRLDLAKSLPRALYTLFHQLQSCLDLLETTNATTKESSTPLEALPTIDIESATATSTSTSTSTTTASCSMDDPSLAAFVVLKIPIPTVSAGGGLGYKHKKQATISFEYDATTDLVLASCGNEYDMGQIVIDELFPGDRGEYLVSATSTTTTTDAAAASRSNGGGGGRAYQWCNYLAGLHIAPAVQSAAEMHSSARVILRALVRRVRATATLSWILHSLSQKPQAPGDFPVHASVRHNHNGEEHDPPNPAVKVSSWTALEKTNDGTNVPKHIRVYNAVLQRGSAAGSTSSSKKTAGKTLTAQVTINLARYPSVVPRWKIASSSENEYEYDNGNDNDNDNDEPSLETLQDPQRLPLYNEELARLEKTVNRNVERLVVPSDQSTYDWILGQQLVEIARGWGDSFRDF
eukprot:jgi/Psemu1/285576/fgenesh1_pg.93_\